MNSFWPWKFKVENQGAKVSLAASHSTRLPQPCAESNGMAFSPVSCLSTWACHLHLLLKSCHSFHKPFVAAESYGNCLASHSTLCGIWVLPYVSISFADPALRAKQALINVFLTREKIRTPNHEQNTFFWCTLSLLKKICLSFYYSGSEQPWSGWCRGQGLGGTWEWEGGRMGGVLAPPAPTPHKRPGKLPPFRWDWAPPAKPSAWCWPIT